MSASARILLLNGPNLNMLGKREPKHYGSLSLPAIEQRMQDLAAAHQIELTCFQANSEEKLIDKIHQSFQQVDFIIINPRLIRTPVLRCVMPCLLSLFLLWKCICLMCINVSRSVIILILVMWQKG